MLWSVVSWHGSQTMAHGKSYGDTYGKWWLTLVLTISYGVVNAPGQPFMGTWLETHEMGSTNDFGPNAMAHSDLQVVKWPNARPKRRWSMSIVYIFGDPFGLIVNICSICFVSFHHTINCPYSITLKWDPGVLRTNVSSWNGHLHHLPLAMLQ